MAEGSIGNIHPIEANGSFGIKSENSPFAEAFYFEDYYDDKLVKRFVKSVEKLVRTSKEYNTYIEGLRTNVLALNHDSVLGNITTADVDLEFHHYPFSLYDIVEVVMLNNLINNVKFTSFSIAKEVMEQHNRHIIGLVPLTKTMHELAHSGNIFIKKNQIFGDYRTFMKDYSQGISVDLLNKVTQMEKYSNEGAVVDFKGLL